MYYASTTSRKNTLIVKRQLEQKGRLVSAPYKNVLNGQVVWTVKYSGGAAGPTHQTPISYKKKW